MFKYQCPRSGNTIDRLNGTHILSLHNLYKSTAVCGHKLQSSLFSETFVRCRITLGSLHLYAHKCSTFIPNTTIFRIVVLTFSGYVYSEFVFFLHPFVTHSCCMRPSQFVCWGTDEKEKKSPHFWTDLATCQFLYKTWITTEIYFYNFRERNSAQCTMPQHLVRSSLTPAGLNLCRILPGPLWMGPVLMWKDPATPLSPSDKCCIIFNAIYLVLLLFPTEVSQKSLVFLFCRQSKSKWQVIFAFHCLNNLANYLWKSHKGVGVCV